MQYIVKKCPSYLLGKCVATAQPCEQISNCTMKNIVDECLQFKDKGRIELILNSKNLTDCGRLSKKIIQILECNEINED